MAHGRTKQIFNNPDRHRNYHQGPTHKWIDSWLKVEERPLTLTALSCVVHTIQPQRCVWVWVPKYWDVQQRFDVRMSRVANIARRGQFCNSKDFTASSGVHASRRFDSTCNHQRSVFSAISFLVGILRVVFFFLEFRGIFRFRGLRSYVLAKKHFSRYTGRV